MATPMKFALYLPFVALLAAQSAPEALTPRAGERTLRCALEPVLPALLYTAPEIVAGYTYSIPLKQYNGSPPEHGWSVIAGFTPDSGRGRETYLTSHLDTSAVNRETISGLSTYWMGLGAYSIRVAISDDRGGVCRKDWTAVVGQSPKSGRGAMFDSTMGDVFIPVGSPAFDFRTQAILSRSKITLGTAAGRVRAPVHQDSSPGQPRANRITILLHVPYDPLSQVALLDVLEALLARIPAESVRLVAFNLRDGREIFRQEGFQWSTVDRLKETFASLQFRAVPVAELQARMNRCAIAGFPGTKRTARNREIRCRTLSGNGSRSGNHGHTILRRTAPANAPVHLHPLIDRYCTGQLGRRNAHQVSSGVPRQSHPASGRETKGQHPRRRSR
jgi:hypothetical protein